MAEVRTIRAVPKLPPRKKDANKGNFGRILVVGGSRGMIGAPALAGNAALRGGAGLVTLAVPEIVQLATATLCPCAVSVPLPCLASAEPAPSASAALRDLFEKTDVLAVGPGMGRSGGATQLVRAALQQTHPLVLDADGLNALLKIDNWPALRRCPMVMTPHPGEFARLVEMATTQVQADRLALAVAQARQWSSAGPKDAPLVLVLKGAGTIVTDGHRAFVNKTGNPGMATGGTGDVLTGLIAALIGQDLSPFDAACLGTHLHGLAGDLAAQDLGQPSLIATDLIAYLPQAFKRLTPR
jgi:NAD(P)H-hydrate epimerase